MARKQGMEVTIWTDAQKTPLVADVLDRMGAAVLPIAVGGPSCHEVDRFARDGQWPVVDDLRKLIIEHPATYVLFASASGAAAGDLALALEHGATVLAVEPAASTFDELAALVGSRRRAAPSNATAHRRPRGVIEASAPFLRSAGWRRAAEPIEVLATPRLFEFTSVGPRNERTLFARLYEAWQVVLRFGQRPETIDASLVGPRPQVPQDLRDMTGHLVVHARLTGSGAATLLLSDCAGRSERALRVIGDEAHLKVGEYDYELQDSAGERLDGHSHRGPRRAFADLIADDWSRLIDRGPTPSTFNPAPEQVLACCLACHLSARTAEPESPGRILDMR